MNTTTHFVNDQKNDQPKNSDRNRSQTDPKANVQHDQLEQQKKAGDGDNPNHPQPDQKPSQQPSK